MRLIGRKYLKIEVIKNAKKNVIKIIIKNNKPFEISFRSNSKNIMTEISKPWDISQIKFVVKLLGATVFQVEGYSEEKYLKDQLVSYNSKTLQNDKKKFVNLTFDQKNKKFDIKGSSYNGEASADNVIGNWWNHKILQASSQISPISGSIKDQVVTFLGKEKIDLYGKVYDVDHFTLKSKDMSIPKDKRLDFDIWYDRKNLMILKSAIL